MDIKEKTQAEIIVDRVLSRLSHINPAVVLASVKIILKYSVVLDNEKILEGICKKLSSPLVTLLSNSDETCWILLKNILILIDKFPGIFTDIKVFFVKYNDAPFIKMEKLKILQKLSNQNNLKVLINELVEYSYDLNQEISRESVKALWKLSIRFPKETDSCISAIYALLLNVNENQFSNHLLNEISIGLNYIFRKFRNKMALKTSINILANNYNRLNEDKSQIAFLDLMNDFLDIIKHKDEILKIYINQFPEKNQNVQMAILTMAMKVYLDNPTEYQSEIIKLLKYASENIENPDLRDRAFIYWRFLNLNPSIAKKILFSPKENLETNLKQEIDQNKLNLLFQKVGTLASIYNDPQFGMNLQQIQKETKNQQDVIQTNQQENIDQQFQFLNFNEEEEQQKENNIQENNNQDDFLNLFQQSNDDEQNQNKIVQNQQKEKENFLDIDFLGIKANNQTQNQQENLLDFDIQPKQQKNDIQQKQQMKQNEFNICLNIIDSGKNGNKGIQIIGSLIKKDQLLSFDFNIQNFQQNILQNLNFKLKSNPFGLVLKKSNFKLNVLMGQTQKIEIPVDVDLNQRSKLLQKEIIFEFLLDMDFDNFEFEVKSSLIPLLVSLKEKLTNIRRIFLIIMDDFG